MMFSHLLFRLPGCAGLACCLAALAPLAHAQVTGNWNVDSNGNWSTGTSWQGGTIPNGIDHIANITFQIGANRTLTLDSGIPGSNVTLGGLRIGDVTGGSGYTISGGTITFQSSTGNAFLTKTGKGGNDTISSALRLNSTLDVLIQDTNGNSLGLGLTGKISGGVAGTPIINLSATGSESAIRHLILNNNTNDFAGQIVVSSGLLRLEGGNRSSTNPLGAVAAGLRGVGNETIVLGGGRVDLRDNDFDIQADDTEIFRIEGTGINGMGALVNTAGTASLSHLELSGDATVGGYSTFELKRHLNAAGTADIAAVLDLNGHDLTRLGSATTVIENADIRNAAGSTWNIHEGTIMFRNRGGLLGGELIGGTTYGNNINGATFNVAYYNGAYDGVDPTNGSRTSDPFNPNRTASESSGNSVIAARLNFRTDWGTGFTHPANTKVTEFYDDLTINLNYGSLVREGNGETGRTFDHIFGTGTKVNLVGGGVRENIFSMGGGATGYNSAIDAYDHPGVTEIQGQIDNTSPGNEGTGFTKRGNRELRLTGNNENFDGDVVVKNSTGRFMPSQYTNTSPTGAAESQFFSLSLAGANGTLNQANSITLTRWGSLALLNNSANSVYASANNNDRLNDAGVLSLRNGFLTLETDTTVTNTENFGNVSANLGTSYLYLDTRAGGRFDGSFASLSQSNGGVLKIYNMNGSHTWGTGATDDRLRLNNASGVPLVGANAPGTTGQQVIPGLFGGSLPSSFAARMGSATNRTDYTVQNAYAYGGSGIGLMTLDNGYLRPLTASEYSIGGTPVAGSNWLVDRYINPENASGRGNYANRNITQDISVNSLTIAFSSASSGQLVPTGAKDYVIIEPGRTLTINSGIINFASYVESDNTNPEAVIRGGYLNMNGRPAIVNSALSRHDLDANSGTFTTFMPGSSAYLRSNMINATDLVKTGRNNLYLETWNSLTGNIYVSEQGSLIVRHPGALGEGGPGREVVVSGAGNFILEYGTNIKGIDLRATNSLDTSRTILRAEGTTHSTWGGNVLMDVADESGSGEFQTHIITARSNGTLTLYGNIYTVNNQNITDNDSWNDPTIISTAIGETGTINFRGQFRDIESGPLTAVSAVGDALDGSLLDRNHSVGLQMRGHDEINVNTFQQWNATGAVYATQGYLRLLYDPQAAGNNGSGFMTDAARAAIKSSNQWNQFWIGGAQNSMGVGNSATNAYHGHVMLGREGQILNYGTEILVRNSNRDHTLTLGGEHESGEAYIGSALGEYNYRIFFQNENNDRDLRFTQTRGGSLVVNARLEDGGTSVNSGIAVAGPGTVRFNANAWGQSTVERWSFLGGEAVWAANPTSGSLLGDNRFAASAATTIFSGGDLTLLGETAANRSFSLTGAVRLFNGESVIRVNSQPGRTTNLTFGSTSAVFAKTAGGTMAFVEEGPGTSNINLLATGLTNTGLMPWAVYGTAPGAIEHFASNSSTGGAIAAYSAYTPATSEAAFAAGANINATADIAFTGNASANTLRLASPQSLNLNGNVLTLASGALLIPNSNTGNNLIEGGALTSGYDANLSAAGTVRDLMIHNWGAAGRLTISSQITNNGTDKVNLVVGGSGTTVLTGDNSFTGEVFLNGGVLEISEEGNLGAVNGGVARLERVSNGGSNGASLSNAAFTIFGGGGGSGLNVRFNTDSGQLVTGTTLTSGGSGYTSGLFLSTTATAGTGTAAVWAIMDSGNLRFDGGTLRVTDNVNLNAARTIFLGANGGTLEVSPGKTFTINGYIASEQSLVTTTNGYQNANQVGTGDVRVSDRNPDIGDLTVRGGGTVSITGAPDGTVRGNMFNSYGGTTWIDEGILRLASAGSSAGNGSLGTHRSWVDGTVIGAAGTLEFNTTSDVTMMEWLTLRGAGYEGGGTFRTSGAARIYRLAGQVDVQNDAVFHTMNGSDFRINEGGGDLFGSGDVIRKGNGSFRFYGNNPEWTGRFISASGSNYLSGAASLQGMTGMVLERNSILFYSAGGTSVDEFRDRLPDNLSILSDGYTRIRMDATGGIFSGIEKVGTITAKAGVLGIEFNLGADIVGSQIRQQGDFGGWHFTEIVREPGASVHLRNFDSGTDFAGADFTSGNVTDKAVLRVDVAPVMVGSGDGTNGNTPVVPGFFGGTRTFLPATSDGVTQRFDESYTSFRLVTVDTDVNGNHFLRALKDSEYKTVANPDTLTSTSVSLDAQGLTADQNLRIVGRDSDSMTGGQFNATRRNSILTLNDSSTVNSLTFNSETYVNNSADNPTSAATMGGDYTALNLRDGAKLTIASGMIQAANFGVLNRGGITNSGNANLDLRSQISGGELDFGGREAQIYVGGFFARYNTSGQINGYEGVDGDNTTLTIASAITNANGLVKTGPGTLILAGDNTYTGDTYINHGSLYLRSDFALGRSENVHLTGAGGLVISQTANIQGVDLHVGNLNGNNIALAFEQGSTWGGDVILNNVDSAGSTGYTRNFIPRIYMNSTHVGTVEGNIYGGSQILASGSLATESRIFTTYTGAGAILDFRGQIRDTATGALSSPVTAANQNQVLRMEVIATTNEANVQLWQQYDSAGQINLKRGYLRYSGNGNFYTDGAAAAVNPNNSMSGFHMGGRGLIASGTGDGLTNSNLAFVLANAGSAFNLSSWTVGGDITDPDNVFAQGNWGLGNTTGNSMIGGENRSGEVVFGTGSGSITFTPYTTMADRDLRLYAAPGGEVTIRANFVDGGTATYGVNTSITKIGAGQVNLQGSSAGASTVEAVNVLGGRLQLEGYDVNSARRLGLNAKVLLGGGTLAMAGGQENLGSLTLNAGGSMLVASGAAQLSFASLGVRNAGGSLHFQSNDGSAISISGLASGSRVGAYATFGSATGDGVGATDWASVDATGKVVAFSGYSSTLGAGQHTDLAGSSAAAGVTETVRFNTAGAAFTSGSLTVNEGGVLFTSNYGGGTAIGTGVGVTTSGGRDLIFHNYASSAVTVAGNITGSQRVVFTGSGETVLSGSNTYSGMTYVTNAATLSMDATSRIGSGGLYLNGGMVNLTGTGSDTYASNITLGSGDGAFRVADPSKTLVFRGVISSEANPVASYAGNNPNSGGLRLEGTGRVQFGTRTDGATLVGVANTYTGLTVLGDGSSPLTVDLQGGGANNTQHTPFGTTDSWTDGTIVRNNVTLEFSPQEAGGAGTDQVRYREWIQFGEQAGDQVYINHSTRRQIVLDGFYNLVGDLNIHTQNAGLTGGGTGNREFYINANEGGLSGSGDIVKTGAGSLYLYDSLLNWTGDMDVRDGLVLQLMYPGASLESTGKILLGDPAAVNTGTVTYRVQSRYGNTDTALDTGRQRFVIPRDISVRDNLKQEIRIGGSYAPEATLDYTGDIYLGSGSTFGGASSPNHVRFYYEDTTGYNGALVGHQQHVLMNVSGNLSGSNNLMLDANEGGSANDDPNDQFVTFYFSGDNSAFTGQLTIGAEIGLGTGNFDRDDNEIFRAGSDKALTVANVVEMRNLSTFQAGGRSLTIGGLLTNDGASTTGIYSFTSPTWDPTRKTTADLDAVNASLDAVSGTLHGAASGTVDYTPRGSSSAIVENASSTPGTLRIHQSGSTVWDAYFRDGVPAANYDNPAATPGSLSIEKLGAGTAVMTIVNDYTGTTVVSEGALQVGSGGNGTWGTISQGNVSVATARAETAGRAVGTTGLGMTTVMPGAALSGSGHVRGSLTLSGTLAPGDALIQQVGGSMGTLYIGSQVSHRLVINPGAVLNMQILAPTMMDPDLQSGMLVVNTFDYEDFVANLSMISASPDILKAFPYLYAQSGSQIANGVHDHLEIRGGVTWNGGRIDVSANAGFSPEAGAVYNLMDWYGISDWGSFNPGSNRYLRGNGDDNGDIDLPDISAYPELIWDTGLFTSHGVLIIAVAPEPGRVMLLVAGLAWFGFRRRRK